MIPRWTRVQRVDGGAGRRQVGMLIVHDASRWTREDHEALRDYLDAHESLPDFPDAVSEAALRSAASRLHEPGTADEERRRVLILLAHHKSTQAVTELQRFLEAAPEHLRRFARLAFEEAAQWNEPAARCVGRNDPCPCSSGRKFKACCGARIPWR